MKLFDFEPLKNVKKRKSSDSFLALRCTFFLVVVRRRKNLVIYKGRIGDATGELLKYSVNNIFRIHSRFFRLAPTWDGIEVMFFGDLLIFGCAVNGKNSKGCDERDSR